MEMVASGSGKKIGEFLFRYVPQNSVDMLDIVCPLISCDMRLIESFPEKSRVVMVCNSLDTLRKDLLQYNDSCIIFWIRSTFSFCTLKECIFM